MPIVVCRSMPKPRRISYVKRLAAQNCACRSGARLTLAQASYVFGAMNQSHQSTPTKEPARTKDPPARSGVGANGCAMRKCRSREINLNLCIYET